MLLYRAVAGKVYLLNTAGSSFGDVDFGSARQQTARPKPMVLPKPRWMIRAMR
jgi:hypothetical protein